ncbi:MAG: DNA-binding domain-containing protein [Myxococcota bacterium]|jgi:hypothetical protein|nr:DNA-binding domain-containing protein [Myxococcota bacterium]
MGTLEETVATMHAVLRGDMTPDDAAGPLGVDPERLAIYQDFAQGHVLGILTKLFPRVRAALSDASWSHLSRAFFKAHPPTGWDLNDAASRFPAYLGGRLDAHDDLARFHVALARFEWEQWLVYKDDAQIPSPDTLDRATLNPTLAVLELPCPIIDHVVAFDRDGALSERLPTTADGPERVLLFRHPTRETCAYWRATDRLVLAIATLHGSLTAEASAAAHGCGVDLVLDALQHAHAIGLGIRPT